MTERQRPSQKIEYTWVLFSVAIIAEYISKAFFLLEISVIIGVILILRNPKNRLRKIDALPLGVLSASLIGVILSKLFFTPYTSNLINLLFCVKIIFFGLYNYLYLTRYYLSKKMLVIFAIGVLPHFFGLVLGITKTIATADPTRFGGFNLDPNYLAPDLLISLLSVLFLLKFERKLARQWFFFVLLSITVFLIFKTISRTAVMASLIIIFLFVAVLVQRLSHGGFLKGVLLTITLLIILPFVLPVAKQNPLYTRIYDRFFKTESGANLEDNERYITWGVAYDVIREGGYFEGYGEEQFLQKKYHFGAHNAWLHVGTVYGKYTFWIHSSIFSVGVGIILLKLLAGFFRRRLHFSVSLYFGIFILAVCFMIFSVSLAHRYIYWFMLFSIISLFMRRAGARGASGRNFYSTRFFNAKQ